MKLTELRIKKITIPFKVSFKHASAERSATQSIWVEAVSDSGNTGYGEGCPREYVTNESLETAFSFFKKHKDILIQRKWNLSELRSWIENNKAEIDKNPAAWCAEYSGETEPPFRRKLSHLICEVNLHFFR